MASRTGISKKRPLVAPSILSADLGSLAGEIKSVEEGGADWLHLDIMDGSFVPPITFGASTARTARNSCGLFLDAHLMIVEPERHLGAFKDAGVDLLTVHREVSPHLHRTLGEIRALGMRAGVCVNPGTPVDTVFDALEVTDLVLIMTVNPGWGGQKFIPECTAKITALREEIERRGLKTLIEVDGGITPETAKICVKAGADVLVAGSYIFSAKNRAAAIKNLR